MQAHGVLAHLQAAGGHAAGVGGLARGEEDARLDEDIHSLQGGRHVGALGHADAAVGQQGPRVVGIQFVLRRAGQRDIADQRPGTLAGHEAQAGAGQLAEAAAADVLQLHQLFPLLLGEAGFGEQGAFGIGQRDHLAAQFHDLLRRVLGDVAGAGDRHALAVEAAADALEHFLGEVDAAVAGGFRTDQAAAVGQALAGEDRGEFVGQAFVLAEEEADFAGADADVTGRHVQVGADVAVQLAHEGLAEAHDFGVALALGVEVRTTLAAAHGQRGQGVLEDLLEGQELQHAQVHRRVEAQAALVGADGAAHLHAEATVDANPSLIVDPRYAEQHGALRLDDPLDDASLQILWMGFEEGPQAAQHLFHRLMELGLVGITLLEAQQESVDGLRHGSHQFSFVNNLWRETLPSRTAPR
ncbi:hypothetical protein D9M70_412830 [compost metagenome]